MALVAVAEEAMAVMAATVADGGMVAMVAVAEVMAATAEMAALETVGIAAAAEEAMAATVAMAENIGDTGLRRLDINPKKRLVLAAAEAMVSVPEVAILGVAEAVMVPVGVLLNAVYMAVVAVTPEPLEIAMITFPVVPASASSNTSSTKHNKETTP